MKNIILNISKILLSLVTIPLWFVHFFYGSGLVMDPNTNEIIEKVFKHTMFENMQTLDLSFMFYVSIVVVIGSILLAAISIKINDKKINKISNIVSIVTIGLFLLCLLVASTVARGY